MRPQIQAREGLERRPRSAALGARSCALKSGITAGKCRGSSRSPEMTVPGSSCLLPVAVPVPVPAAVPSVTRLGSRGISRGHGVPSAGPWGRAVPVPGALTPLSLSVGAKTPLDSKIPVALARCPWSRIPRLLQPLPSAAAPGWNRGRVWDPSRSLGSWEWGNGSGRELQGLRDSGGHMDLMWGDPDPASRSWFPHEPRRGHRAKLWLMNPPGAGSAVLGSFPHEFLGKGPACPAAPTEGFGARSCQRGKAP